MQLKSFLLIAQHELGTMRETSGILQHILFHFHFSHLQWLFPLHGIVVVLVLQSSDLHMNERNKDGPGARGQGAAGKLKVSRAPSLPTPSPSQNPNSSFVKSEYAYRRRRLIHTYVYERKCLVVTGNETFHECGINGNDLSFVVLGSGECREKDSTKLHSNV